MIYYFSGTGNSEVVAKEIAKAMGDKAVNLVKADPEEWNRNPGDVLGFVFPIYGYQAPWMVLDFAAKIHPGDAFTFGVCTFTNVVGEAMQHFSDTLPLKAAYSIKMPDNYPITDHIIDTEESCLEKLRGAEVRLQQIIPWILEKQEKEDILKGDDAWNKTYVWAPKVLDKALSTKGFHVTPDTCVGCGLCEKICPAQAIRLENGEPKWVKDKCCMCMGCLNRCPAVAIECGPYSKGRFRYYFKGFDTSKYFQK